MKKFMIVVLVLIASGVISHASSFDHHQMQHGFVLGAEDNFASHLVATGHHSRQTEIVGILSIADQRESEFYQERKRFNQDGNSYFLLQAQNLNLPSLKAGQILEGHIVESKIGSYEPKNIIVVKATFKVERVLLNMENPFFGEQHQGKENASVTDTRRAKVLSAGRGNVPSDFGFCSSRHGEWAQRFCEKHSSAGTCHGDPRCIWFE